MRETQTGVTRRVYTCNAYNTIDINTLRYSVLKIKQADGFGLYGRKIWLTILCSKREFDLLTAGRILVCHQIGEYSDWVSSSLQRMEVSLPLPKQTMFLGVCPHWHQGGHASVGEVVVWTCLAWSLQIQPFYLWDFKNAHYALLHLLLLDNHNPICCCLHSVWHRSSSMLLERNSCVSKGELFFQNNCYLFLFILVTINFLSFSQYTSIRFFPNLVYK